MYLKELIKSVPLALGCVLAMFSIVFCTDNPDTEDLIKSLVFGVVGLSLVFTSIRVTFPDLK